MQTYNQPHRKEKRKQEAEARNEAYSKLTPEQKLQRLDDAGFKATRQRIRLHQEIEACKSK